MTPYDITLHRKKDFELFKKGFSINVKQKNRDKKKVEFHSFRQRQPRFRGYFRRNEYMVRKADTVIAYWESLAERGNILHGEQGV